MDFPFPLILFLSLGHLQVIVAQHYDFEPTCIPECTSDSDPLNDDQPCMCRPDIQPAGCQIAPCGPGEDASDTYVCQCTEYFQPYLCVTLSCDNGTSTYGPTCPYSINYPSYNPSQSYPSQNYPSSNYPSPSYSPSYYPASSYPTSSYPSQQYGYYKRNYSSYPSSQYGYSQPSYNPYPSYNLCNNYCVCEPYLPADCTDDSIPPIIGGPACACNPDVWLTGCTIKPCTEDDADAEEYACECTEDFDYDFCVTPRCTRS